MPRGATAAGRPNEQCAFHTVSRRLAFSWLAKHGHRAHFRRTYLVRAGDANEHGERRKWIGCCAYANLVTETIKRFEATLRADGLLAAMRWLNGQVPYRYSAVFGFDGDRLHNICLIDKENPHISKCPDQPITDSYCMYIQRSGDRFSVETALKDARVEGHPKQRSFQCYYGIPLYGPNGQMLGTVCHFDGLPVRVTEEIASALDEVGPLIADAAFSVKTDR
jgi:GAF domain-containing protein